MSDNFAPSLAHVLASEGGWVNDPRDPGGATNEGVTQHVYDNWRLSHGQALRSVRVIDPNEVEGIYRKLYWNPVHGDQLPSGVDYCTFDCAINSGAFQAAKFLQRAVDADDDGHIGPDTLAAVSAANPLSVINRICAERLAFLEKLPTWSHFAKGWSSRVSSVEIAARGMAA